MAEFKAHLQQIAKAIVTIEVNEAIVLHKQGKACFIDLRDGFELIEYGKIPGAEHCPRGSLEFRIPSSSKYHSPIFSGSQRLVFYCSHGERSILATDTAQNMGLEDVCHIKGGMKAWVKAGGKVEKVEH